MKNVKKLSILTLTIALSCTIARAHTFFEPQWNEFCPNQYANISLEKNYKLAEKKYWQQRKKDFNSKINQCRRYSGDKLSACYASLRQIEGNATALHIEEVRIKQQEYANAASMTNAVNYTINSMKY